MNLKQAYSHPWICSLSRSDSLITRISGPFSLFLIKVFPWETQQNLMSLTFAWSLAKKNNLFILMVKFSDMKTGLICPLIWRCSVVIDVPLLNLRYIWITFSFCRVLQRSTNTVLLAGSLVLIRKMSLTSVFCSGTLRTSPTLIKVSSKGDLVSDEVTGMFLISKQEDLDILSEDSSLSSRNFKCCTSVLRKFSNYSSLVCSDSNFFPKKSKDSRISFTTEYS